MPIYLTLASLIIDKKAIEKKYKGGINQFRTEYFNKQGQASQEDDEVFMIAKMNWDDFNLKELMEMGFSYHPDLEYSNDFVIYARYHGFLWKVDWIEDNEFYAWHIDTPNELKIKVREFENITMNKIHTIHQNGQEAFIPLTMENRNSHPIVVSLDSEK